jgi:predicted NBD/HSP70 family sugar kinase
MNAGRRVSDVHDSAAAFPALTPAERSIFDLVRREPGLSRTEIARRLSLSPAMLTKTVTQFCRLGLMSEERDSRPRLGRGQPALRLAVPPHAAAGIGISLSTAELKTAAVDLSGTVRSVRRHSIAATAFDKAASALTKDVQALIDDCERVTGIAISVPALLGASGEIVDVTPSQRGIDFEAFRRVLSDRFSLPVWFESKAPAVYEAMRESDLGRLVYMVFLDYGIGGSLIENMRVFPGGYGQASNLGALVPDSGPRPSLPDLATYLDVRLEELTSDEIGAMMDRRDPRLLRWVQSRGKALSKPLSIVVHLINPTAIVVGGTFPRSVLEALIAKVDLGRLDYPGRAPLTKPVLRVASVAGPDAMAVAAAAVPIAKRLTEPG